MLTLTIEDDQGRKTDVPVAGAAITIGRAKDNQLRLNERNISRKHARLTLANGGVLIEDLDSYNGIRINGDRISGRANLFLGDRIQVGDFQLQVHGDVLRQRPEEVTQKTLIPKKNGEGGHHDNEVTNTEPMIVAPLNTGPQQQIQARKKRDDSFDESTAMIRLSDLSKPVSTSPQQAITGPSPRLVCVKGPMAGREWPVAKTEVVIGRGQENDICIDHRSMSRIHAKLVLQGATYRIVDLGGPNGTFVNGEQYAQVALKKGDTIELGHVKLRLVWPGEVAPAIDGAGADNSFDESTEISNRPRSRAMEAEISAAPAPSSKKGIYIVAAVGVAVISVSAVLVIALQGEPKQPPPIVVNNTQQALPENAPPSNLPQQALTPTPPQPERKSTVPDVMRRANELMINENWEQAIRTLEAGLDTENGNAELKAALDHAENERGTKATFDAANGAQQRGDYMTARELFQQVPDSSMYAQRAQKKLSDPKVKNAKANAVKQAPIAQQEKKKADPVEKATPPPQVKEEPVAVVQPPPPTQGTPREQAKKLYEQGTKSLSQNRLKESIEYFLEATRTDPKFARPHRDLGIAHARAGNGDAAVEHYRLYLQLFPSAPDAESVKKIISDYEAD